MMKKNNSTNSSSENESNKQKFFEEIAKVTTKSEQANSQKKEITTEEFKGIDSKDEILTSSSDFKRICFIGQGSSGLVEKALYIPKNLIVALKVASFELKQ
jgi:hypothetical protein